MVSIAGQDRSSRATRPTEDTVTPPHEKVHRGRILRGLCGVSFCLMTATATMGAQPPIGFERWTDPEVPLGVSGSDLAFGLTPAQIYQEYAIPFPAPGFPGSPQKDRRLIDIEVRSQGGLASYVYDIVWVVNTGGFKLDSWFLFDLTEGEVHALNSFSEAVILDIERYPKGNGWRFAVILQRNTDKYPWQVLTSASLDEILDAKARTGSRIVDIDYYSVNRKNWRERSGPPSGHDAVLVSNTGGNYMPSVAAGAYGADYDDMSAAGFQLVDREGNGTLLTLWVKSMRPFLTYLGLTQNDVIFHHGHHGRVVDLEIGASGDYHTVNLP
ncbi:MAG: hypothetical protein AB9869_13675 [Verrucomicrobiia bacterium]